jgi:hypothetical protein
MAAAYGAKKTADKIRKPPPPWTVAFTKIGQAVEG